MAPFDVAPCVDGFDEGPFPLAAHDDGGYVMRRDAILEESGKYPVKGWMIYKQNPLAAVVDGNKTLKLMEKMDFICSIDVQPSQTAWMADIILPETTYLERLDPVWTPGGTVKFITIRHKKWFLDSLRIYPKCGQELQKNRTLNKISLYDSG